MIPFILPSIIAAYRYSMATYIMADNPEIDITEAIKRSIKLMDGYKGKLLGLQFSFFGWIFLCAIPVSFIPVLLLLMPSSPARSILALSGTLLNILWITPYMEVATATFYLRISGD